VSELLDQAVELLFRYRPLVWEKGRLALGASRTELLVVAILALAGAVALAVSARATLRAGRAAGVLLLTARGLALLLLLVVLLRPQLVVTTSVSQQNVVGVLVDDSRSMEIADGDGSARGARVRSALDGQDGLLARLAERYQVRLFRFSGGAGRIATLDSLVRGPAHRAWALTRRRPPGPARPPPLGPGSGHRRGRQRRHRTDGRAARPAERGAAGLRSGGGG